MGNSAKRDAKKIAKAERQRHALELRKQGFTYEAIGLALICSTSNAHKLVREGIEAIPAEAAKDVRSLELARLDKMQEGLWDGAKRSNVKQVFAVLAIMERRARYLGLDKQTEGGGGEIERGLATAEAKMAERIARLAEAWREEAEAKTAAPQAAGGPGATSAPRGASRWGGAAAK